MKTIISAALFATMLTTPAVACTNWQAIAAFDAIVMANDEAGKERCGKLFNKLSKGGAVHRRDITADEDTAMKQCADASEAHERHYAEVEQHRAAALADTCQESAK